MTSRVGIDFTVGSRRLLSIPRELATWAFSLEEVLGQSSKAPPQTGSHGLRVLSAPTSRIEQIRSHYAGYLIGGRQDYRRHYIDMSGTFDDYLARFSGKTRSTLRRKARKLDKDSGGYRITEHHRVAEIEDFLAAALPLSSRTYQARLLDAGLPDTPQAQREMIEAGEQDAIRCFLLWAKDKPIAYLSLPVEGDTLVYAHLGYDPDWAKLSPGTVLQMEALERLFAEQRYRYFDFTEGEGAHKAMFGTAYAECASFVLLEPTIANRALLSARGGFDTIIAQTKTIAERSGALGRVRSLLRA